MGERQRCHTGRRPLPDDGIPGSARLVQWAEDNNLEWDAHEIAEGHAFGCRYESLLTGPLDDPDPATWKTRVAIHLAD